MAANKKEVEIEECLSPPVLHILIVGFHHQKGSTIEYSYPPLLLPSKAKESITTTLSESTWRHLPHLALPDGCHNYEEESVYFTLPGREDPGKCVFGVACCRQIEAKELPRVGDEVTRSTVQKSICVLSKTPMFGFIEAKLTIVTHAYFNAKDFSDVQILHETYEDINSSLNMSSQLQSSLYLGVSYEDLITVYHHRLLQLYKALLLQKKVILFGSSSTLVCKSLLSILSLFSKSIETLAGLNFESKENVARFIFSDVSSFQPYLCLQQMEEVKQSTSTLLAGVVNPLFQKRQDKLCDAFADTTTGQVVINDQSLRSGLHLSAADLRFCGLLSETVGEKERLQSDWLGSNDWVRAQFNQYLVSLLKTTLEGEDSAKDEFNSDFMSAWGESSVYKSWLQTLDPKPQVTTTEPKTKVEKDVFSQTPPKHLCTGEMSMSDVKRRLVARASDYGLNVQSGEQVVQQTQQAIAITTGRVANAVSSAWTSASTAVYNWWGGSKQQDND